MVAGVEVGLGPQQHEIGLGFGEIADLDRVLDRHHGPITHADHEATGQAVHAPGVAAADARHPHDLPVEQLDALVGAEDLRVCHTVVVLDGEPVRDGLTATPAV